MPNRRLAIHPAPFKPSHLSIPPSPFSHLSPLTPALPPHPQPQTTSSATPSPPTHLAPTTPLKWQWTCHACHTAYPLGATRRCLDDGHHFCAGTSIITTWRKGGRERRTKRHKACASSFDYLSWKTWGQWRRSSWSPPSRNTRAARKNSVGEHAKGGEKMNCETQCDYPSQCRWGGKVDMHIPVPTPTPTPTQTILSSDDAHATKTPLLTTAPDLPSLDECFAASPPPSSPSHDASEPEGRRVSNAPPRNGDALPVSSAQRRLRRSHAFPALSMHKPLVGLGEASSPLDGIPVEKVRGWKKNMQNVG